MWTLREALGRTAKRSATIELEWAQAESRADPENEDARADLAEAIGAIQDAFLKMMAAGRAEGLGTAEESPGELVAIPARDWPAARIDWDHSAGSFGSFDKRYRHEYRRALAAHYDALSKVPEGAEEEIARLEAGLRSTLRAIAARGDGKPVRMVSVRVRPWLHHSDVPGLVAGLPLSGAFRRFVLGDPEFAAIVDRASKCFPGQYSCMCSDVLDGGFAFNQRLWPADLTDYDLAVEWMDALPGRFARLPPAERRGALDWLARESAEDRAAFAIVRAAEAVVRDRMNRLLDPLRSGAIVATGRMAGRVERAEISPAIWARPSTRVDFVEGDLFRDLDSPSERGKRPPALEWTEVMLSLPLAEKAPPALPLPPAPPEALEEAPRPKGGRPPKHDWNSAFARLMDKLLGGAEPESGDALAGLMFLCFQEMKARNPPDTEQISRWLRTTHDRLWVRYRRADGE